MLDIIEDGWCGFPKLSLHCPADASASEVMVVAEKGSPKVRIPTSSVGRYDPLCAYYIGCHRHGHK